jgi:adenylate cyclase class 2
MRKKSNNFYACNRRLQELSFLAGGSMAVETEIKLRLRDLEDFRRRLKLLNPRLRSIRHFEENFVLDHPDGRLRSQQCLLRVRKTKGGDSVTLKGPPLPSLLFKTREEWETQLGSSDVMLKIFEQIGMTVWFRYQKYREEYSLRVGQGAAEELHVALDSTPIGDFAELEGSEGGIREVAGKLGFTESEFLRESYYSLFAQFCRQRGEEPGHMVFSAQDGRGSAGRQ